jgi:membrane protein DedA with SNARE-associated domain
MMLVEYIGLFILVVTMGVGVPALGDAALIAAATLAGEGRLHVGIVISIAIVAWMLGSLAGYALGLRKGRWLLDHPGRFEESRRKMLAKGDRAFGHHNFAAAVTMPAYVSGIFRVAFRVFVFGAVTAGGFFIALYVGPSYFLGPEIAERIGTAGTRALIGVLVIVAIGLGIKAALSRWRAARLARTSSERQR